MAPAGGGDRAAGKDSKKSADERQADAPVALASDRSTPREPALDNRGDASAFAKPDHGEPGEPGDSRFLPGTLLAGRYRMVSLLGRGGMGEVYRADDLTLAQPVALKFLPEAMEDDDARLARFLDEVRIARRISHPNVCRVYDVGEIDGHRFLSMEYIDGEDLASLLRRIGRLPKDKAVELGRQLASGLDAVHREGVLHLDLKPGNVMIDGRGQVRITDFGIAALVAGFGGVAARHGTPAYTAPEQLAGRAVSAASDLYSLGLVLYEMFTGRRAIADDTTAELDQTDPAPAPPSRLVDGLEPAADRVILRCLEMAPGDRPPSALAVAEALAEIAGDSPSWRPEAGGTIPHRPHWMLEKKLGEGGFGEVWLATHGKTHEPRVFKFCRQTSMLGALQREITVFRLLREELGERDDIVRILDWSFEQPPYFVESEYTEGGDLKTWADERGGIAAQPLATRLEIVSQVATALAAAHSVGVLHKDVKPSNVLIAYGGDASDDDRVRARLTDFGLGAVTERQRLAAAGITVQGLTESSDSSQAGTRLYMAPELMEGKRATLQADVYALGVMLYQMVVGDLSHALAPGWERDITDELLRGDVAAAVDGSPQRRLGDAGELATRLRTLDERRAALAAERRRREEAERTRAALERAQRKRKLAAIAVGISLLFAITMGIQTRRIAREAARARDIARVAVAGEWLAKDPTTAALVLLEVNNLDPYAVAKMRQALAQELAVFELADGGPELALAWSPDSRRIATAGEDGNVRLWDAGGSGSAQVFEVHAGPVLSATFDPNPAAGEEDILLTASSDGTARLWSPADPDRPIAFEGHRDWVQRASFSPDGARILTVSDDGTVCLWRRDGSRLAVLPQVGVFTASFEPAPGPAAGERRVLLAADDGTARVWDPESGEVTVFEHDGLMSAAWSPDGDRVATTGDDGSARIWKADGSGEPIVLEYDAPLWSAAWSPDGEHVLTSSVNTAQVWRADRPSSLRASRVRASRSSERASAGPRQREPDDKPLLLQHDRTLVFALFSPDGGRVLTAGRSGTAWLWDLDRPHEPAIPLLGHSDVLLAAAWSPDGRQVVTSSADGSVRLWNADTEAGGGSADPALDGADLKAALASATRVCLQPGFREQALGELPSEADERYQECERSHGRGPE